MWPRLGNIQDFSVVVGSEESLGRWSHLFYLELKKKKKIQEDFQKNAFKPFLQVAGCY